MTRRRAKQNVHAKSLEDLAGFPLLSALLGRRSRRFPLGATIPSGPLAHTSDQPPMPLSQIETALIVSTMTGNTGWHHAIPFNAKYSPSLPNYAGAAGGRIFPSAAGFHTTDRFYTDDSGVYFVSTRDTPALKTNGMTEEFSLDAWLLEHQSRIKKISNKRLEIPREEPHIEGHNLWVTNVDGSLFAIPVVDVAQHVLLGLCYWVQNGYCIYDDIHKSSLPGIEKFKHLVDIDQPYPLTYAEQVLFGEATVEVATSCFAGALILQAMGLGGWMYDGVDRHSVFGVSGDPRNKGLGFRCDTSESWSVPNPTGLPGVFEAFCPPRFPDMRAAVDAVVERKFGRGGPFHPATPGPWKDSAKVRGAAKVHSDEFKDCVATMAQYVLNRFGKFPATLPSVYCLMYLQAHHLDLEFYDKYYGPGAYLHTHETHMRDWHSASRSLRPIGINP